MLISVPVGVSIGVGVGVGVGVGFGVSSILATEPVEVLGSNPPVRPISAIMAIANNRVRIPTRTNLPFIVFAAWGNLDS